MFGNLFHSWRRMSAFYRSTAVLQISFLPTRPTLLGALALIVVYAAVVTASEYAKAAMVHESGWGKFFLLSGGTLIAMIALQYWVCKHYERDLVSRVKVFYPRGIVYRANVKELVYETLCVYWTTALVPLTLLIGLIDSENIPCDAAHLWHHYVSNSTMLFFVLVYYLGYQWFLIRTTLEPPRVLNVKIKL